MTRHPVLAKLVETGTLSADQADAILVEHKTQGIPVQSIAIEQGFFDEAHYLAAVATLLGTQRIHSLPLNHEAKSALPASLARMYNVVLLQLDDTTARIAVSDLLSPDATDELAFALSRHIDYVVAAPNQIEEALENLYGNEHESVNELLTTLGAQTQAPIEGEEPADLEEAANTAPVIRFVNLVLYQAVKDRASDIHFEPFEDQFKIRYRVDGTLFEMAPPPLHLALPIISRIKVISNLDIAETRLPQDGRIQLTVAGRAIDFRVSTLPTQFGESVVLRVLDRSNVQLDINNIGFPKEIKTNFLEDIRKPNGIIIVTGPTGSGKTTTLYAALQQINQPETKILTAEDPVEYDVEGIIQLPIHDGIGLTFASALRAFLRQDPDVIMVGEIRDLETAQIAIQASLTGHLVFSTLHTNDAPGAITRLIDMEVEPYLIASTLETIMGQRLVRTICPHCKTAFHPDQPMLDLLDLTPDQIGNRPFHHGTGCDHCTHTGYSGRCAIFEYMNINNALRAAIIDRRPTTELRHKARELGMRTLREDGIRAILDAKTTVEEIIQYT